MDVTSFLQVWTKLKREGLPPGILISGPRGLIQGHGREDLLENLVGPHVFELRSEHHIRLQPDEDRVSVSLDSIRQMQHGVSLCRDPRQPFFVVVPQAAEVTLAGWNVLLKVLEEPPPETHFIVFSQQQRQVPMTVRSRLLAFFLTPSKGQGVQSPVARSVPLSLEALKKYLSQKPTRVQQWDEFLQGLYQAQQQAVTQQQWDQAVRTAGALIEISDILGRKRQDGSINLKYAISSVVARYVS